MKIIHEWEQSDIKCGTMYCRGTIGDINSDGTAYMLSTLAKIGYLAAIPEDISSDLDDLTVNKYGQKLVTSTAMTDGMTLIMLVEEMVEHLNSGGYVL